MVLTDSVRVFRFDKINHRYVFIIASKLYSISFFSSGIFLQQPIALLEGISSHFSNVYCIILKETRGRELFDLPG